jgi:DAACS family dicarboxylate/amino acid:cation (Na+ or H+) symporter
MHEEAEKPKMTPFEQFLDNVPTSLVSRSLIIKSSGLSSSPLRLASPCGAFRSNPDFPIERLVMILFQTILIILTWVIAIIPLAVFGIVASTVGTKGFHDSTHWVGLLWLF